MWLLELLGIGLRDDLLCLILSLNCTLTGRYAEPRYKMEKEVEEGKLVGSMYGVLPNKDWKEPVKAAEVRQTVF